LEHRGEPSWGLAACSAEAGARPGGITDNQKAAWCGCIEVFDEPGGQWHQVMLFPKDREAPDLAQEAVDVRLYELQVLRPRQWGACWLSGVLWEQLQLVSQGTGPVA